MISDNVTVTYSCNVCCNILLWLGVLFACLLALTFYHHPSFFLHEAGLLVQALDSMDMGSDSNHQRGNRRPRGKG